MAVRAGQVHGQAPIARNVERLFVFTVGARSANSVHHYSASHPFPEHDQAGQEKGRDEKKVGNGDKHTHQRGAPSHRKSLPGAPDALWAVESQDRCFARRGGVAVTGKDEFFGTSLGPNAASKVPGKKDADALVGVFRQERATGLEPATSSLGSAVPTRKLIGPAHKLSENGRFHAQQERHVPLVRKGRATCTRPFD